MKPASYYKPSGKAPLAGVITLIFGGLAATLVLSIVYAFAIYYIPIVYANFFALIGLVFGIFWVTDYLVGIGKIRNLMLARVVALILGLAALYLQWIVWLMILSEMIDFRVFFELLLSPGDVWEVIGEIGERGVWSISSSDTPVSGGLLWLVWIIEALVIAFGPMILVSKAGQPFCEQGDCWLEEDKLDKPFKLIDNPEQFRQELEGGKFDQLLAEQKPEGGSFARLTLFKSPSRSYLSVENVTLTQNKKGEVKEDTKDVVKFIEIDQQTASQLAKNS
jgi:hypothetical protein